MGTTPTPGGRNKREVSTQVEPVALDQPELRRQLPTVAVAFLRGAILAGIVSVPILISFSGEDTFRRPKEVVIVALAIVLAAAYSLVFIWYGRSLIGTLFPRTKAMYLTAGILLWTAFSALTATNRSLSLAALGWVAANVVIGVVTVAAFRSASLRTMWIVLVPAAANAIVFISQRLRLWSPLNFGIDLTGDSTSTGFLGNIDYVGSYLLAPVLVAIAMGFAARRGRIVAWITAVLLLVATLMSSVTATIATVIGVGLLLFLKSRRYALVGITLVIVASAGFFATHDQLRSRATRIIDAAIHRDYDALLSSRLTAFVSAWDMARDHPLTGVGPGCFPPNYFRYKLEAERKHPGLLLAYSRTFNFGQVHNDHLQVLAELGIVGYLLFLAVIVLVARVSLVERHQMRQSADERQEFTRLLGLPLAASFSLMALAQFPLHLPASLITILFVACVTIAWSPTS